MSETLSDPGQEVKTEAEPSPEEIALATYVLSKFRPGYLPYPLFEEISRLTVNSVVEIVPLRKVDDKIQVLLTERDEDDPIYAGIVHTPGTVIRSTDQEGSYQSAFERIFNDELASVETSEPQYLGSVFHQIKRGREDAKIFFVEVRGEPATGKFYDVDALPDNTMDSQIDFIRMAAKKFAEQALQGLAS